MNDLDAVVWIVPLSYYRRRPRWCDCCELPLEDDRCPLCQGERVACVPPHECRIRGEVIGDPEGCAAALDWRD